MMDVMITKEFNFDIGQKVTIKPFEITGRVTALYAGQNGVEYRVRYFDNCERRDVYFYADELEAI